MNFKTLISIISFSFSTAFAQSVDENIEQNFMSILGTNNITIVNNTDDILTVKPFKRANRKNAHNCMQDQPWSGIVIPAKDRRTFFATYNASRECALQPSWQWYYIDGDKLALFKYFREYGMSKLDHGKSGARYTISLKDHRVTVTKK